MMHPRPRRPQHPSAPPWLTAFIGPALLLAMLLVPGTSARAQDEPAPAHATVDQPVNLRPQWEAGQTSRYEFWTRRTEHVTATVADQTREQENTIEIEGEVTWTVQRVAADGSATCTMTLAWLTGTAIDDQGQRLVNDSRQARGDVEPMHDLLRAMAGVPLEVRVAADGTVESVRGIDAIRRQLEIAAMAPEELDFIESATDLAPLTHAPARASLDDTWQADLKWTHTLGHMHHDTRFELAAVERIAGIPVATVTAEADLDLEVDRSDIPEGAPPVEVKLLRDSYQGQIMFDLQRREAVGRNTRQETSIEVTVRLPQGPLRQQINETIQYQALRIAEEE